MVKFAHGVVHFQRTIYPEKKDLFQRLAIEQRPEALFITCSDSRIETAMLTQSEPGDLFICRNAGNIVPPHTDHTGGMTASIEYAVAALNVAHIIVCGHNDCGAMRGAMEPNRTENMPHVRKWLSYAKAAIDIAHATTQGMSDDHRMDRLIRENIKLQLQHLRTHPSVAVKLAQGQLDLHGWLYDIESGTVEALDHLSGEFRPVTEIYSDVVDAMACGCHGGAPGNG